MPIYEYVCNICSHDFEILQGFREAPLSDCPACGEIGLRKKVSVAAFHLKGTGWYETDFKNKPKQSDKDSAQPKSETRNGESEGKNSRKSDASSQKSSKSRPPARQSRV